MSLPKKFQNQKLQTKKNHSIMAVTSNPEYPPPPVGFFTYDQRSF